jgi:hypothetical protein
MAHSVTAYGGAAQPDLIDADILSGFAVAPPTLLEARALQQRVDRKYLLSARDIPRVLAQLQPTHCVVYAGAQLWARYQSVYFDTPARDLYHAHRRGRRPRYKLRIRHHLDRGLSFLEVKQKAQSGRTVKHRLALPFGQDELSSRERSFIDAHAPLAGTCLCPQVAISFQRLTVVGRDIDERLTLDQALTVASGRSVAELGPVVIAEVKQARFVNHSGAIDAIRALHAREGALSKYCLATAMVSSVPDNVFKPALRAVARLAR